MHPPHQPKTNDFGRKISLHFEKSVSISGCIPPTNLNLTISAENSVSISVKTFFFFFFGDHLILGGKNVCKSEKSFSISVKIFFFFYFGDHLNLGGRNIRISEFGRKISLHFSEDIQIFEVLCLKSLPTKIFWIRHCNRPNI